MRDAVDRLSDLLAKREILIVVGTGGVGKTTVAAALALEAARRGRRVLALTIDPARRLCDALGLAAPDSSANQNARLAVPIARSGEAHGGEGALDVVMLDMKTTFDGLVDRFAENDAARERIMANPIYAHVSDALAGSGEYAAMEKVYELSQSGAYDLIVVDTPPSQHALDFLDAPRRLVEFLESRLVQLLFHPAMAASRFGFKLFNRTGQKVLQVIERISGVGFLEDISEFLMAFEGMSEGFRDRATHVRSLLLGKTSSFLLVVGPTQEGTRRGLEFLRRMSGSGVPVEGVLMNRIRSFPEGEPPPSGSTPTPEDLAKLADALARAAGTQSGAFDPNAAAETAVAVANRYAAIVEMDQRSAQPLRTYTDRHDQLFLQIPQLEGDVSDLDGLSRIGELLLADSPGHERTTQEATT